MDKTIVVEMEVWFQNHDGDEVSKVYSFSSKEEAEKYFASIDGTFTPRGRLVVSHEIWEVK